MTRVRLATVAVLLGANLLFAWRAGAGEPPEARDCCSCTCLESPPPMFPMEPDPIACASQIFETGQMEAFEEMCKQACAEVGLSEAIRCEAIAGSTDVDPGLCGVGTFADCPDTEAGRCDDGLNNDAWIDNDTDHEDADCRSKGAPAVSHMALALLTILLLGFGTFAVRRRSLGR